MFLSYKNTPLNALIMLFFCVFMPILCGIKMAKMLLILSKNKDFLMFNLAEVNALCEKYYISERGLNIAMLNVIKEMYKPKRNVHFFDLNTGLICHIDAGKYKYFKPNRRAIQDIRRRLIAHLSRHKARLLREKPSIIKRAFLERFGGEYVRASIVAIEEEMVIFSLVKEGRIVGNLKIYVPLSSFFDSDKIGIGHNFMLRIKGVKADKRFFILSCVRRDNGVLKREIAEIVSALKAKLLAPKKGSVVFTDEDFKYRMAGVNISRKEVRVEIANEKMNTIMVTVSRLVNYRLGFKLKWRIR